MDPRTVLWVVLILSAPWAIVLVVALVRGYTIHVTLTRPGRPRAGDDDGARDRGPGG